jgi:hypothetical protein
MEHNIPVCGGWSAKQPLIKYTSLRAQSLLLAGETTAALCRPPPPLAKSPRQPEARH